MAKIKQNPTIELQLTFTITESEARALNALAGYSNDALIKFFYENMGRHYMEPHEAGFRLFLDSIRGVVCGPLARVDKARKAFVPQIEKKVYHIDIEQASPEQKQRLEAYIKKLGLSSEINKE